MTHPRSALSIILTTLVFGVAAWVPSSPADTQLQFQFQVLHGFGAPGDGGGIQGGLVLDQAGNVYGVTAGGGENNGGIAFELSPGTYGEWTETILHNFPANQTDGSQPVGIAVDDAGNVYGMTEYGGNGSECEYGTCGTIFELSPGTNGQRTESIIWDFCSLPNCADGGVPQFGPTVNSAGDVFGVSGPAFELTPGANGWSFTVLNTIGSTTTGSLTLDAKGNLYDEGNGGTINGECGRIGCGRVYALHQLQNGRWKEVNLYNFGGSEDGYNPSGGVSFNNGALYGTTEGGGGNYCFGGCGTVFQITRGTGKSVNEQVIHAFGEDGTPGVFPQGGVVADSRGNLFGNTGEGGADGDGIVYGLKPQGNGSWQFVLLHTFVGTDGLIPDAGLTMDSKGNLYGETAGGGPNGGGVVFELSPTTQASK